MKKIKWNIEGYKKLIASQPKSSRIKPRIVYMSPHEFLSKVPSIASENIRADQQLDKWYSVSSIKYIKAQIARGEKINIPFLDYTRMFRGWALHEGRHRAFIAKRMGIKKIPVMVVNIQNKTRVKNRRKKR